MTSKGRGRKRRQPESGESFMEGIFQEVEESMANEKAALNAFNQLKDMQITKDSVKNLPPKALSAYLAAKFDARVVSFVTSASPDLAVLPPSLRWETLAKLTGLSESEVSSYAFCKIIISERFLERSI